MPASPPTSRVIAVLEALAASSDGIASAALARSLGLSTSTVSLILGTLQDAHYVERLADKSYQLGPGLMRLLASLQNRFPILGVANEELTQLAARFGCGTNISRVGREGQEVVLTAGPTEQFGITPGVRVPIDPPHGTMSMAWRSHDEIELWLSKVPTSIRGAYRKGLAVVRDLGFAVYGIRPDTGSMVDQLRDLLNAIQTEHDADHLHDQLDQLAAFVGSRIYTAADLANPERKDVSHIIAPIFAADHNPRYLISLQVMKEAVSPDDLRAHIDALLKSAETLTNQIGGQIQHQVAAHRPHIATRIPPIAC